MSATGEVTARRSVTVAPYFSASDTACGSTRSATAEPSSATRIRLYTAPLPAVRRRRRRTVQAAGPADSVPRSCVGAGTDPAATVAMDNRTGQRAGAVDRDTIAAALHAWRIGAQLIEHPALAVDRVAYERAVAVVQQRLAGLGSMADLTGTYVVDRDALVHAAAGAGRGAAPTRELLAAVAVDTAFWRRCRTLVTAGVG